MNLCLYKTIRKSTLLSAVILTAVFAGNAYAAATPAPASPPVSKEVLQARQESQIWTTLELNPYLRGVINVTVNDGKATLSGEVDEDVQRELAREIALGVKGIKEVDNEIVVRSERTSSNGLDLRYADTVNDVTITAAVKAKLIWSKYTSGLSTKVDTKNGKVVLSGTADTAESKDLAGRLAANTKGVRSVTNNLTIAPNNPGVGDTTKKAANDAGKAISDAWITAKVKSTFIYSTNVDEADIDVATVNGAVTLKGKVESGAEHALAIELASNVRGVKSVDAKGLTF